MAGGLTALLAIVLDRIVFSRLRHKAGAMTMVFASFGVALLVRNVVLLSFGPDPLYYSNELQIAVRLPIGVRVMPDQMFVLALTVVLVVLLHLFLTRSLAGLAMRAMAENPDLARVSGVDVAAVVRWTWILGGVRRRDRRRLLRHDRAAAARARLQPDPAAVRRRDPRRHRQHVRCGDRRAAGRPVREPLGDGHPVRLQAGGAVPADPADPLLSGRRACSARQPVIGVASYLVFFLIMALIFGVAVLGLNLQWGFTGLFNAGVVGFIAVGAYATAILIGPRARRPCSAASGCRSGSGWSAAWRQPASRR